MTTYTFSLSSDFGSGLDSDQLGQQIESDGTIVTALTHISTAGDVVDVIFASPLSGGEQTALNVVVAAHVPLVALDQYVYSNRGPFSSTATTWQQVSTHATDGFSSGEWSVTVSCQVKSSSKKTEMRIEFDSHSIYEGLVPRFENHKKANFSTAQVLTLSTDEVHSLKFSVLSGKKKHAVEISDIYWSCYKI